MEQKRAQEPNLSIEALDQMITDEFVDWFKKTVNNCSLSHLSYTHD